MANVRRIQRRPVVGETSGPFRAVAPAGALAGGSSGGPSEMAKAVRLLRTAASVVQTAMRDARLGAPIDIYPIKTIACEITERLIREKQAMLLACKLYAEEPKAFCSSVNIAVLLVLLGRQLGLTTENLYSLALGGLLHKLPSGALPQLASDPIANAVMTDERTMVEHAATKDDPLPSRLVMRMRDICSRYEEMTVQGHAGTVLPPPDALRQLLIESGEAPDSFLTKAFIKAIGIYPIGSLVRLESGRLALVTDTGEDLLYSDVELLENDGWGSYRTGAVIRVASKSSNRTSGSLDCIVAYEGPINPDYTLH